jgi:hypothetical protein
VVRGGFIASGTLQPYNATTGSGNATTVGELPIVIGNIDDCCLSGSAIPGFTQINMYSFRGDGGNSYGGQGRVLYGSLTTSTAIASTTIPFTGDQGTYALAGLKLLVLPQGAVAAFSSTPSPVFTPAPAPQPTATAIPIPVVPPTLGCAVTPLFQNGVSYPANWAPYSCTSSPWNQRVSANPMYASNSGAVIATQFGNGNSQPVRSQEAGTYDYGHPIYYATSNDPLVKLRCTSYCNTVDNGGYPASIRIPAAARPAGGTDGHMVVIQPDGTEIDFWAVSAPSGNWTSSSTVTALSISNCGNFVTGSGFMPVGPAATAGGACLGAGLLRANELASGAINHALFLITQCAVGWQYPAFPNAVTDTCSSGQGPALGGRLWYDVPVAITNANTSLRPWEKAILNALHDYGGYLEDDFAGGAAVSGIGFLADSGAAAWAFGQPDPFAAMVSQGWSGISVGAYSLRYIGGDPWRPAGVDFAAHMHWLNPCSARGTC